jgi:hypothetical protein
MPLRFRRIVVYALACCLGITSCTTVREVGLPSDASVQQVPDIQPGDHVVVLLKSGKSESFKVTSVGTVAVYGRHQSIAYSDIQSLEIRKINGSRTAWLAIGIVVGLAAVLYAALLVALTQEEE